MTRVPGELMGAHGEQVLVHRAWPRGDGSLIVEGREKNSGRVRAGRIDIGGYTSLEPFREDPALPALGSEARAGDLLVHRLNRRAVVRLDGQYRKFIAGGKAAAVADAHLTATVRLANSGLAVPDVVASDQHSVTLAAVPGVSLHELGRNAGTNDAKRPVTCGDDGSPGLERWRTAWKLWAHRWPRFVEAPTGEGATIAVRDHTAEDEAQVVARWTDFAIAFDVLEVPENQLREAAGSVVRALLAGTSPARLAHRDLHDKQVLVDPDTGAVGIIDCDTLAVAEPALDLANLAVHLDFRATQGLLSTSAAALGKHYIREVAEVLQVPDPRFNAYAAATALRLACIYAFRPPYRDLAQVWLSEIATSLTSGICSAGAAS